MEKGRKVEAEKLKKRAVERQLEAMRDGISWLGMTVQTPFLTSAIPGNAWSSLDMNSNTNLALLQKLTEARALQRYYAPNLISTRGGLLL
ncbi:hypothetical protein [Paenibacillus sp. FSL H7-0331]|uniref:hypothetical protein n=1 Tax=Paenibacillus sp. FSL H7-0331 TaxID=1920421 RepID=UPI00096CEE05|nr:hypothetical protein [Paenibacillus sp. FSL H7-0331]OMF06055.1 hypothetical protein BK127_31425 [Paenibacillus sp. FSL H7-0331]